MESSARKIDERINQGVFITGKTGSGKSRMTKRLAGMFPRQLYVDPMESFEVPVRWRSYAEARKELPKLWYEKEFVVACTFRDKREYPKLFMLLFSLAEATRGSAPDLCLVVDEVDLWSGPEKDEIDESLSSIIQYGRHYGISWIANCRADVMTNRVVRMNAAEIILFRQSMLSAHVRAEMKAAEEDRGGPLPRVSRLTLHGPDEPPDAVEGSHFVAVPDPFSEWLPTWEKLAQPKRATTTTTKE